MSTFGLRGCVLIGAIALSIGSGLKSGLPFVPSLMNESSSTFIIAGTFLIGLSQPLYQSTPTLLSSTWFPPQERTIATALALNSNQLGIGFSFLIGAFFVGSAEAVPLYFRTLTLFSVIITVGTAFLFEDFPPTPPSASAPTRDNTFPQTTLITGSSSGAAVGGSEDDDDEELYQAFTFSPSYLASFFTTPGFWEAIFAFTTSAIVINTLSTFLSPILATRGHGRSYIGAVGFLFQVIVMASSYLVGRYTDRTKNYFTVTLWLLLIGAVFLFVCSLALDVSQEKIQIYWMILIVASTIGPLQPVSTELGCEVVYPKSENIVLVLMQLSANLFSALFIPVFDGLKDSTPPFVEGTFPQFTNSFVLLSVLHLLACLIFAGFKGEYRRDKAEDAKRRLFMTKQYQTS